MKCPSCIQDSLVSSFIEDHFRAHTCKACKGNWILIEDFISWIERNEENLSKPEDSEYKLEETTAALICPLTGTIMLKYGISNDTDHKLDYSPHVGGVWLDPGEWEYLKEQGLASRISSIFTHHWQKQLRDNDTKAAFTALYEKKFGEDDYRKAKEVRQWLDSNENKLELRAYLLAQNPYGA